MKRVCLLISFLSGIGILGKRDDMTCTIIIVTVCVCVLACIIAKEKTRRNKDNNDADIKRKQIETLNKVIEAIDKEKVRNAEFNSALLKQNDVKIKSLEQLTDNCEFKDIINNICHNLNTEEKEKSDKGISDDIKEVAEGIKAVYGAASNVIEYPRESIERNNK